MQNSVLKLISIAGVLGIGTLVVLEVHKSLPKPGSTQVETTEQDSPGEAEEVSRFAETDPSEFQLAMNEPDGSFAAADSGSAGMDTDPFAGSFDSAFTEPDVGSSESVDVRVDPNALTDDVSPFGADETLSQGNSVPVRSVGYAEDQTESVAPATSDAPDFSAEAFLPDADGPDTEISFDPVIPEPVTAANAESPGVPDASNPFEADAGFSLDPEPTETNPAPSSAREPNTLQFFPEDQSEPNEQPALTDDRTESLPEFDSPFSEDAVPVAPAPATELRLDSLEEESGLQPTPQFDNEELRFDADEPTDYGEPDLRDPEPQSVEPTGFDADDSRNRMFEEGTVSDDAPLPFFDEDETAPATVPADRDEPAPSLEFDSSPNSRFETPIDPTIPEETPRREDDRLQFENLDRRTPVADPRSVPIDFDPPGRARVAPERDRSRDINFDRSAPRTFRAQPALSSDERRFEEPELEIRPRGRTFERGFDGSRSQRAGGIVPASASTPVSVLQPHLTVRKDMPPSATLGVPLTYTLTVTNEGRTTARNIIVEDSVPESARVEAVNPPVEFLEGSRTLQWEFSELAAGATERIEVRLVPTDQGILDTVATVRFKAEVKTKTVIQAPKLALHVDVPSEIKLGNETQLRFVVRNEGDGTATNVVLRSDLPPGLRHPIGDDLEYSIGTLEPNEEREVILDVVAAEPGNFSSRSEILAAGAPSEVAETKIHIVGQQIEILRRGPQRRYVNRSAVYENILTNDTAFPASDILVVENVPVGMKFEKASHNGAWNPEDGTVVWKLRELPPGETTTLKIKLVARTAGEQESTVTVIENAGFKTAASHTTAVEDINHMGARISGNDRPVAVGEVFSFDITAHNRGTTQATGVVLTMDLPPGIMPVSTGKDGPQARPERNGQRTLVRFDPIRIDSTDEKVFRINLKATSKMTDAPVHARIRYDQTGKELVTTESVTAYFSGP